MFWFFANNTSYSEKYVVPINQTYGEYYNNLNNQEYKNIRDKKSNAFAHDSVKMKRIVEVTLPFILHWSTKSDQVHILEEYVELF